VREGFSPRHCSPGNLATKVEWAYDSAFRFFPVEPDSELGWRLNFWDAATNKTLALVGRQKFRDLPRLPSTCTNTTFIWGAGMGRRRQGSRPLSGMDHRLGRARQPVWPWRRGGSPLERPFDFQEAKGKWLVALAEARALIAKLPPDEMGCLYMDAKASRCAPTRKRPFSRNSPAISAASKALGQAS